jgi:polyphosphate kinase
MDNETFFNRDLSWLSFNERVLLEAGKAAVPLLERINFLSIYSSNLDEFYRVRMPVLMAIDNYDEGSTVENAFFLAKEEINKQQNQYGNILNQQLIPELLIHKMDWIYNKPLPDQIVDRVAGLFFTEILAHINPVNPEADDFDFFAENNKLYQAVIVEDQKGIERLHFINIPSDVLPRLYLIVADEERFIVFIDDIIKHHLPQLFPKQTIKGSYNVKITRNAELNLEDELDEDIIAAIEKELARRDYGAATRFLCEPGMPLRYLYRIMYALNLQKASIVEGGPYHNLKDLNKFPFEDPNLQYPKWPALQGDSLGLKPTVFDQMQKEDFLIHVPYQSYDPVLRFFSEAATDPDVDQISTTLYRVASNSKIVTALITAAKNGKKVTAMLELKARFDEANNIKWASRMKDAGVRILYSRATLKVHAKVALVKKKNGQFLGILSTGNFNETTARFYTDHILFTAHQPMLKELEQLFGFLSKKKKIPGLDDRINFEHLLVAQFNLQSRFLNLIDREINQAKQGKHASIIIKVNNLEERVLISKLYDASMAGVKIQLIVRSICCLIPGVSGRSENITVKRIVDRYLEHGRIFIFHNEGQEETFMGSADWMNRNVYSRIEVCFPIRQPELKLQIRKIIDLQLKDNVQAVELTSNLQNKEIIRNNQTSEESVRSQEAIYQLLFKESLNNLTNDEKV